MTHAQALPARCQFRRRRQGNRFLRRGDGCNGVAQLFIRGRGQEPGEIRVGAGKLRVQIDGFAIGGDCFLEAARPSQRGAAVAVSCGEAGRQLDGFLMGGDGFLQAAGFHERDAERALCRRVHWLEAGNFLENGREHPPVPPCPAK